MDSETDSSVLSSLTILDSVKSELSERRLARTIWAHTRAARDGKRAYDGKASIKYCIYCTEPLSYGNSIITNMRHHLRSKYQISIEIASAPVQ
jgi:hypothetical protein